MGRRELWHERERQRHGTAEGFSVDVQSADAGVALARRMITIRDRRRTRENLPQGNDIKNGHGGMTCIRADSYRLVPVRVS